MSFTNPSVTDFKNYFVRDFPYGLTPEKVMDVDISKGIDQAADFINPDLFGVQSAYTRAFLFLSAHYMVMDIRASSQGVSGGYTWLQSSKSVGSVSVGASIPSYITDNPIFAMIAKTSYGVRYLEMIIPLLAGNFGSVQGATSP